MTKPIPDLTINRLGTHLFQVTRKDGTSWLKWDWDQLLAEVIDATSGVVIEEKAAKKNLVKETEKKVTKSRAKKTEAVVKEETVKKPAAKKAATKKPAAKKAATKKTK